MKPFSSNLRNEKARYFIDKKLGHLYQVRMTGAYERNVYSFTSAHVMIMGT